MQRIIVTNVTCVSQSSCGRLNKRDGSSPCAFEIVANGEVVQIEPVPEKFSGSLEISTNPFILKLSNEYKLQQACGDVIVPSLLPTPKARPSSLRRLLLKPTVKSSPPTLTVKQSSLLGLISRQTQRVSLLTQMVRLSSQLRLLPMSTRTLRVPLPTRRVRLSSQLALLLVPFLLPQLLLQSLGFPVMSAVSVSSDVQDLPQASLPTPLPSPAS
ncbi:hypothetical protein LB505_014287 [Fusarium chuoi]|nr:hypothetical protein LB505_014287 [Fusarium chuoi]